MGNIIVKPNKDKDMYVEWSSICDCPNEWGSKEEMLRRGHDEMRLERADEDGTSSYGGEGNWDDWGFIVHNMGTGGFWELKRENMYDFLTALTRPDNGVKEVQQEILEQYAKLIVD